MRSVLLVISGSIAAYKALELIRRLRERGYGVTGLLTAGGAQFITPLSVSALTGTQTYSDLFSLKDEVDMGHIRLSREHDLILVAPASADLIAKMAQGRADDLASTTLLAADKPILIAPAMNVQMWHHAATQRNLTQLRADGVQMIEGTAGDLACGETGAGRMAEPDVIADAVDSFFVSNLPLSGKHMLVTAGATHEPIDPVRYIANRSSGKQGYAITEALANLGAKVTLISGPTALDCPQGVNRIDVTTAEQMHAACMNALPADAAICAAAVADWKVENAQEQKWKKSASSESPSLKLSENPDILADISAHAKRPALVVGFAAETESLLVNAKEKLLRKGCDWMVANDVSDAVFGEDSNAITLLTRDAQTTYDRMSKQAVARLLADQITDYFYPEYRKERSHG